MKRFILLVLFVSFSFGASAEGVPSPDQFLGYPLGAEFTPATRIVEYLRTLDAASPLISLVQYGETYEGRPLVYAVITSEANQKALETIRKNAAAIAHADRTSQSDAEKIARESPAIVWLGFGIHGNEASSSEAAMRVAYELVSGGTAAQPMLDSLVVIVDPLENPDGRERYVQWFRQSRGLKPDPNPSSLQHYEPWPGGRYNHYLIDMNRDWSWMSQKETEARVAAYREWNPQVFVDFHEMGYGDTYFFPPDAHPINSNISGDIATWLETFGRGNAEAFSRRGWPFFVSETFDLFYPGYGDSWPSLRGAVGMTYEMAGGGRAGSAVKKEDQTILSLSDRAERHTTSAMATVVTAAAHKNELILRTWRALHDQAQKGDKTYFILPGAPNFPQAVDLLRAQGIDVGRLEAAAKLNATSVVTGATTTVDLPAGAAVISTRQPLGGLADSLLERTPALTSVFLEQQKKRVEADQEDEFYDVTAWSIPIAFDLDAFVAKGAPAVRTVAWPDSASPAPPAPARFAYLVDGLDPFVYQAVGELLSRGINFSVSDSELTFASRHFARGTLVVLKNNNAATLDDSVREIVATTRAEFVGTDSPWDTGTALGSEKIHFVRDPKIAIVAGSGVGPTSFGMLWHTLDADLGVPHTVVPVDRIDSIDLSQFRVIVLPDGDGYAREIGKNGIERLQAWAKAGGTLVGVKGAGDFFRDKDVELSKAKIWPAKKDDEEAPPPERHNDYRIPGAAFRTTMRAESYLTFGLSGPPAVIVEGSTSLLPASYKADNVITVVEKDPLVAGFAFPQSIERVQGSPWLLSETYGKGRVITFADQPFFRLFWRSTLAPFVDAVVYSPSF